MHAIAKVAATTVLAALLALGSGGAWQDTASSVFSSMGFAGCCRQ